MQRQVVKREVKVIQPTLRTGLMHSSLGSVIKQRVAAYARVSTEHEEQQSSYEAQVDYYTRKIKERSDWAFVEVYTDAPVIIGLKQNPTQTGAALVLFSLFMGIFENFR